MVMRKFIVSDLHGDKVVYDSIMNFLENIAKEEEVELYINGDLIDRGKYSYEVLCDCIERVNGEGPIKVNYLAGNHEFLMCEDLKYRFNRGFLPLRSNWILNGGDIISKKLWTWPQDYLCNLYDFMMNLDVYHRFEEKINGKNLLLVHAKAPKEVSDTPLKLGDSREEILPLLWNRSDIKGNSSYTTIIGHTPVQNNFGFSYDKGQNVFNIDGGSSYYEAGYKDMDHIPLVEVKNDSLVFLIFNHSNQITNGFLYKDYDYNDVDLDSYRVYLSGGGENSNVRFKGE